MINIFLLQHDVQPLPRPFSHSPPPICPQVVWIHLTLITIYNQLRGRLKMQKLPYILLSNADPTTCGCASTQQVIHSVWIKGLGL